MLVGSPLRSFNHEGGGEEEEILESFPAAEAEDHEFSGGDLFDCINFDDIFMDDGDRDLLPDLEMELDILADFPASGGSKESSMDCIWVSAGEIEDTVLREVEDNYNKGTNSDDIHLRKEEITISKNEEAVMEKPSWKETDHGGRKSTMQYCSKDLQRKRKLKVDWTPELHRRFVRAVEQLGVDKAVPSRILELMGIDCLTRHNVASHLQKYRKHLQAREAKAASWSKRGQLIYSGKGDHSGYQLGGKNKGDHKNPIWLAPTMGFPPPNNMALQTFRPSLHVWGHPSSNHLWPKHLHHPPYPPWAPPPPPPHASFWHPRPQPVPHAVTPGGALLFPHQTRTTMRFPSTTPPRAMCRAAQGINGVPNGQSGSYPLFDSHPSKECIDAAIGDVLSKPWLPLPLGLKPPSIESVSGELQHQGVSKIHTTSCA